MATDLIVIYDLGTLSKFSAIAKVYLPANFRINLTMLGDDANFGAKQEHFSEDYLTWSPNVTMMMCHEKRGDTCLRHIYSRCHD